MKRFTILMVLVAGVVACSSDKTGGATEQVLYFDNGGEPEYLDPAKANDTTSTPILDNLFEGLVIPHPVNLRPLPGVAEKWEISPDGRTYTFHLRKDAKWTDGKPVTAADFVYAWTRALDPKTASKSASRLYYIKNGQAFNEGKLKDPSQLGFKADGDYKLVVTLQHPFPPFLELLTWCTYQPVRQDVIEKFGEQWTRPKNMVSNGPFLLDDWVTNKHVIIKKSPNYWDAKTVKLDKVVFVPMEDTATGLKQFLSKKLDWINQIPFNMMGQVAGKPELDSSDKFAVYNYIISVKKPVVKDVRVRQALSLAIDRDQLANQYLNGLVRPANYWWIPPGVKDYPYFKAVEFNPEKAKKLLAEAGYSDPSQFPTLTLIYNTNENHKLVAEVIQQMWKKNLGIQVNLMNVEWKTLLKQYKSHDFEIGRYGGVGEYIYPTTFLESNLSNGPSNYEGWSNPKYDQLWAQALAEPNPSKKLALYAAMERLLADEVPSIPLYYYRVHTVLQNWVRGFYRNILDIHNLKWTWIGPKDRPATPWEKVSTLASMPMP